MKHTGLCLQPGDRVRLTKDVRHMQSAIDYPDEITFLGTKGSIGVVMSFEEYRADHENYLRSHRITNLAPYEHWFVLTKAAIAACSEYPIRLETVLAPKIPVDGILGKAGAVVLFDASSLEKIE